MSSPGLSGAIAPLNRNSASRVGAIEELGGRGTVTEMGQAYVPRPTTSFAALLRNSPASGAVSGAKTFGELRERLFHGDSLTPRDLIALQIRAGELGVSVELVSKIADGILGIARRLQTPQ